ncbi:MAG: leucyl aminopeptidase [Casimicrobiaceae bacterium]|nr:leucyl aminopeptidase [Casimicrobiaceae bacterium]MCX8097819.1 leucyl aminopeptidase [Casimicrobiaceae bacterium]MDW8311391.1 leucyl aminopeptidase [Burkholderiales bacterium]
MINFSFKNEPPHATRSDAVAVFAYEGSTLSEWAAELDRAAKGALAQALKTAAFSGRPGTVLPLLNLPRVAAPRVYVAGGGPGKALAPKDARAAGRALAQLACEQGAAELTVFLPSEAAIDAIPHVVFGVSDALYRFDETKSEATRAKAKPMSLTVVRFGLGEFDKRAASAVLARAVATAKGMAYTKHLGNLPPNHCTPTRLAEEAQKLAKDYGFKVRIYDRVGIEKLGMGSFLSVAQGSEEPPRFIVLEHHGGKKGAPPTVLVGKGITFDSGGISIKPSADMDHMKWDMSGAGTVLGVLKAVGELKLRQNVVGLIPACENLPSGKATKPGDVFKSMSGLTIEVLNTDAEGRLILCDALTYAERYKPRAVIDIATLTGACVVALGKVNAGLFSPNDELAQALIEAGRRMNDRFWRMPLEEEYQEALNSNFADVANVGGRDGGAITAACFLWRFAKNFPWAHLDIAGVAYQGSGKEKGATGRPVPALVEYLAGLS